ncbi:hypothetical protein Mapa_016869 [Marchantia paleacea]|nr:hypothetical protein Mapa_016869 [Marchantia paleacea]
MDLNSAPHATRLAKHRWTQQPCLQSTLTGALKLKMLLPSRPWHDTPREFYGWTHVPSASICPSSDDPEAPSLDIGSHYDPPCDDGTPWRCARGFHGTEQALLQASTAQPESIILGPGRRTQDSGASLFFRQTNKSSASVFGKFQ